jgi:hypothetical protein
VSDPEVERLERELEDLRDQLATTRHDVEKLGSRQGQERPSRPRFDFDGDDPAHTAARGWLRSGGARGWAARAGWGGDKPNGLRWAAYPFRERYRRRWRRRGLRLRRKLVWLVVWLVGTGVAATVWGPGSPLSPALKCGPQTSALARQAAAGESVAVRTAKLNGRLLRSLAGQAPDPRVTQAKARDLGHAIAVSVIALQASVRGEVDPPSVRKDTAAYRAGKAAQLAASSCAPVCPPGQEPRQTLTVAATTSTFTAEQQANAATIRTVGQARGVPVRGQVVALAAALQESGLRNLDHGDRDSVGVFQQRAGWGPVADRMNVATAAGKFYDALGRVPGWQSMTVAGAAQAVQRSAFPGAYARWETAAAGLVGAQPAAAACSPVQAPSTYRTGAGKPWGGYQNGRIPFAALAHPRSAPDAWLRPDAADALDRLSAAYAARFGHPLGVTDSYRDLPHQVSVAGRKPGLAAKPGTSNHGWGLALDLRVGGYGSTDYLWLRANAPAFGWDNPDWARPGGTKHEWWHWEWQPTGART